MRFEVVVANPQNIITFSCQVHHARQPQDHLIEPEFYKDRGLMGVPQGDHYELELTAIPPMALAQLVRVHIHQNPKTKRKFVSWPEVIPTFQNAVQVFNVWCVGTMYTLTTGDDFFHVFGRDAARFFDQMDTAFGIKIIREGS